MSPDSAEKFLEALGIAIARHLGDGNIQCHCPFHRDEKPSFSFHGDKEVYNCFSCGESGSYIKLVELIEDDGFIPDIEIDIDRGPLTTMYRSLEELSHEVFKDTNEAIRSASVCLGIKDWCWDRLDQVIAFLPSLATCTIQDIQKYQKRLTAESREIVRFLRASEANNTDRIRELVGSTYYKNYWIIDHGDGDGRKRKSKCESSECGGTSCCTSRSKADRAGSSSGLDSVEEERSCSGPESNSQAV